MLDVLRGIKGYVAKSNRESDDGCGDIFLRPKHIRKPAIIIEVKIADSVQDLEKEADATLDQIEKEKYADELKYEGYTEIIKDGISFYRKNYLIKLSE